MNADTTTLRNSHRLFRKAVVSVFTHTLPDPAPFRQASRDLENAFQTALELVPNHRFFPVHMFRVLIRLRRTIRRWTALIPKVVRLRPIPGLPPFPPTVQCPSPWRKHPKSATPTIPALHPNTNTSTGATSLTAFTKSTMSRHSETEAEPGSAEHQLGTTNKAPIPNHASPPTPEDAPRQPAAQRAATHNSQPTTHNTSTTHHASQSDDDPMSIPQALQHERRQAWKLQIDLPTIHLLNPLAPNRPRRSSDTAHPTNASRRRPWPGWKELPGPQPKPYNPDTEKTEDLSHPFHQALCDTGNPATAQPGSVEFPLGKSIESTSSIPSTTPTNAARGAATHNSQPTTHNSPSLLDSPLSYQRHLDSVLLQVVTTLVRAYAKTQKLADRTDDWTPMPQFESTSKPPTKEQIEAWKHHPSYLNSIAFFDKFRDDLEKLLRKRLEAIWFHAHNTPTSRRNETGAEPGSAEHQLGKSTMSRRNEMKADMSRRSEPKADSSTKSTSSTSSTRSTPPQTATPPPNPTPPP